MDPKDLIVPPDFKSHWVESLSEEEYHADKTAMNSTLLRKMKKSPLTFKAHFDGLRDEETESQKFGTMAHMVLLQGQKFWDKYRVMPEFIGLTKDGRESKQSGEAREKKAAWLADLPPGCLVVTPEELDHLKGMVESLLRNKHALEVVQLSKPEVTGYYRDPVTGIKCRARIDLLAMNLSCLGDLKTTKNCTPRAFMRSVYDEDYLYQIQLGMYDAAIKEITGSAPELWTWIAIEKKPPYEVYVHEADPPTLEIGRWEYRRLMNRLKLCIDTDNWPGVQSVIEVSSTPNHIIQEYQLKGVL